MTPIKPEYLNIAQIQSSFGVKGELKVRSETNNPKRFKNLTTVRCLLQSGKVMDLSIEHLTPRKDGLLLMKFAGFDSPESVGLLRNGWLQIPYEEASLPQGQILYADVIGLEALDHNSGELLGHVVDVYQTAQDLLEIKTAQGQLVLIPWVDQFVKNIDLSKNNITLAPLEGMFD
jgi:16S rRNA processing protein RimM